MTSPAPQEPHRQMELTIVFNCPKQMRLGNIAEYIRDQVFTDDWRGIFKTNYLMNAAMSLVETPHPAAPVPDERPSCNNCSDIGCGYACDIPCGSWKLRPYPVQIEILKKKITRLEQENLNLLIAGNNRAKAERERIATFCNQRWFEVEDDDGEIQEVILKGDVLESLRSNQQEQPASRECPR
jgi:hypothetical protein